MIALSDDHDGGTEIYATDPDGTDVRPLTDVRLLTDVAFATDPSWSPDGTSLAFDDGTQIFTAKADGVDTALVDTGRVDTRLGIERTTVSRNVSVWRPTRASNDEPTNPSVLAVDSRIDDYWSSGGYPTQWVEVDLGRPTKVAALRLIAPDLPSRTAILVLGRADGPASPYRLLHQFKGPTIFEQELAFAPRRAWRGIRYVRLQIPVSNAPVGWVAWPEIEVDRAAG